MEVGKKEGGDGGRCALTCARRFAPPCFCPKTRTGIEAKVKPQRVHVVCKVFNAMGEARGICKNSTVRIPINLPALRKRKKEGSSVGLLEGLGL